MTRETVKFYYDGDCPICNRYADYIALKKQYDIQIYNAREHIEEIRQFSREGYDINKGMIVAHKGRIYHGAAAIVFLDSLVSKHTWTQKAGKFLINIPFLMRGLYPVIKIYRRIVLKFKKIDPNIKY